MQCRPFIVVLLTIITCVAANAQGKSDEARNLFPIEQNKKWGYIDRDGKTVIPPQFEFAEEFSEGLALVQLNGKWGFIDASGTLVIDARYSSAHDNICRIQLPQGK